MKSWKRLEEHTRNLASIIWKRSAQPERIGGVNFDAVLRISEEEIILIEITEEFSLEKVRGDVSKIVAIKLKFLSEGVLARAYIVLSNEPTPGMIEIARESKIIVCSVKNFIKQAFDYQSYINLRRGVAFGSAINPTTGEPDRNEYIPVVYTDESERKKLKLRDICSKLGRGERIILLGDYGTGKSRCTKEVFDYFSSSDDPAEKFLLSINLREHWGATTAIEIIAGHLQRLGMSEAVDKTMQLLRAGHITLILDGFDEVGSQTFGANQDRRASIRKTALQGIRELIAETPAGLLITGRPHYFNSHQEMYESLGINTRSQTDTLIKCAAEFDVEQAKTYLENIGLNSDVPEWLPRKPLMFQILAEIESSEADRILSATSGEIGFWGQFIDTVCIREAKIHTSIDPASVREVLTNLASYTRLGDRELGRLSPKDVNRAYETATGMAPDESGQLMLSRLCTLGRIEPESPDRQFVDPYIVQLLFAESLVEDISNRNYDILGLHWRQSIQQIGLVFLAQWIELYELQKDALSMVHRMANPENGQAVGELVAALTLMYNGLLDFGGLRVQNAEICMLHLGLIELQNVGFINCIFGTLAFDACKVTENSRVLIQKSYASMATGLTSKDALPPWAADTSIEETQSASNASRIKSSNLPAAQKLFLSIIQKIFFQRGGGRKESSLYKGGFGEQYDRKIIDQILSILVNDGFVEKSKDNSVFIYNPKREFTPKMRLIRDQLGLSKDELWLKISTL
ncbi:NACHT domain-containing protein [Pseudomonas asplenii]|uniref:NACHT domain-containing protein n=1 Tax=Pseudomonas asplenii TaxID=53407 RepID=UPI00235E1860|nr:NACHT domain-containing protein [Pseudomonas asplenii]